MIMDYSNLWKLLAEKGLSKSDLMELTGLSSRIIAKLNNNKTVTTDTIAKICAALSCDVGDVVVIKGRPAMISGLDEGIWVSSERAKIKGEKDVFVMTEAAFKVFSLKD